MLQQFNPLDVFHWLFAYLKKRKIVRLFLESNYNWSYKLTVWNKLCFEKIIIFLSSQEIFRILWKSFHRYRIYKRLLLGCILMLWNPIYSIPFHFITMYFNISSNLLLGLSSGFFLSGLSINSIYAYSLTPITATWPYTHIPL